MNAHVETREESHTSLPLMAPPATGFLCLPFEIRMNIYRYCIPQNQVFGGSNPHLCHLPSPEYSEDGSCSDINDAQIAENDTEKEHGTTTEYQRDPEGDCVNTDVDIADLASHPTVRDIIDWKGRRSPNPIFQLSSQISAEALDILYGGNIFELSLHESGDGYFLLKNFTTANRQRIRNLLVVARPVGYIYDPEHKPDQELWSSILPHLQVLRIVAQQPQEGGHYSNSTTLEQDMECWICWISLFFQCFGESLTKNASIQVDTNGAAETKALVGKYLTLGYREIQCHQVGDVIFKRGAYSLNEPMCCWEEIQELPVSWDLWWGLKPP